MAKFQVAIPNRKWQQNRNNITTVSYEIATKSQNRNNIAETYIKIILNCNKIATYIHKSVYYKYFAELRSFRRGWRALRSCEDNV